MSSSPKVTSGFKIMCQTNEEILSGLRPRPFESEGTSGFEYIKLRGAFDEYDEKEAHAYLEGLHGLRFKSIETLLEKSLSAKMRFLR